MEEGGVIERGDGAVFVAGEEIVTGFTAGKVALSIQRGGVDGDVFVQGDDGERGGVADIIRAGGRAADVMDADGEAGKGEGEEEGDPDAALRDGGRRPAAEGEERPGDGGEAGCAEEAHVPVGEIDEGDRHRVGREGEKRARGALGEPEEGVVQGAALSNSGRRRARRKEEGLAQKGRKGTADAGFRTGERVVGSPRCGSRHIRAGFLIRMPIT